MRNILGPTTLSLSLGGPAPNGVMLQWKYRALAWNPTLRLKTKTKTSHLCKCFGFLLRKYCISILSNPATITEWQNFGPVSVLLVLIRGVSLPLYSSWNIFSLWEPTLHFILNKSCWKQCSMKYFNISFVVANLTIMPQSLVYKQGISSAETDL